MTNGYHPDKGSDKATAKPPKAAKKPNSSKKPPAKGKPNP